ncbi:hypothetical protein Cme02nite_19350 [Catellatospora methionotrophica]|uniref:Uncharacterized protein n=1 Tax=Catellatospora methionotrophica TaxID=121620 RepID=A0A8J3L8D1_9ACTN|nr:hypothetical protein [Catellatospora methionotrophica]GIG13603.1 hypothetical protein Cme02nite_19350 [Catellatospora methionotrophica]
MEPATGPWSPLTISTMADGRRIIVIGTAVAAAAVTLWTLGRTRLTWGRDLDLA